MIRIPLTAAMSFLLLTSQAVLLAQQVPDTPAANPARPTVSNPATLSPVGYLQFETGYLFASDSPEFSSQSSFNEVVKFSIAPRLEILAGFEPFARSHIRSTFANGTGDISLGFQGVIHEGEGVRPTIAVSYLGRVYAEDAPDLDIGSFRNSALLLGSADVKGFHYDINFVFNEQVDSPVHRLQFGQTLSISHDLGAKFGISGEVWRFTQPFIHSNAVGNLWAANYNLRPNLVLDAGFDRGLTNTATRWQIFTGFTYLLPHKIFH